MVGPAAAAEVELELIRSASSWTIGVQIAEGALEWNSDTRLRGTTTNGVGSWVQGDNELVQLNHHQTVFTHQEGLTTLVILWGNEDAHVAEALCTAIIVHTNCIGEGHVGKMSEASKDIAAWCEVEATGEIHIRLLPEGGQLVGLAAIGIDLDASDGDAVVVELSVGVGGQTGLVLLEDAIDIGVPSVEDRITHGCGGVTNDAEGFQMLVVCVVGIRDEDVAKVVQISVLKEAGKARLDKLPLSTLPCQTYQRAVGRENGGFHDVAKSINASGLI